MSWIGEQIVFVLTIAVLVSTIMMSNHFTNTNLQTKSVVVSNTITMLSVNTLINQAITTSKNCDKILQSKIEVLNRVKPPQTFKLKLKLQQRRSLINKNSSSFHFSPTLWNNPSTLPRFKNSKISNFLKITTSSILWKMSSKTCHSVQLKRVR